MKQTSPLEELAVQHGGRPPRKLRVALIGGAFLVFVVAGFVVSFSPLKSWLAAGNLQTYFASLDTWEAPFVYVAASAALMLVGMPRLLVCSIAGVAFGVWWGLAWSLTGTLLGSYIAFAFVRWSGRRWALNRWPKLEGVSQKMVGEKGVLSVVLIRQIPISGFYNNVLLAMTRVNHRDFLVGSLIGFLPGAVPAVMVGAGLIQTDLAKVLEYVVLAIFLSIGLGLAVRWLANSPRSPARRSRVFRLLRENLPKDLPKES